jgi:hypothetical protein
MKGESLDLSGLAVTAIYSDGTEVAVTEYDVDTAEGTALDATGERTIMVSYTEGEVTQIATFSITVIARATGGGYVEEEDFYGGSPIVVKPPAGPGAVIADEETPLAGFQNLGNPFVDVFEHNWYYGDVLYVYHAGLMAGTSDAPMLFGPDMVLTRGMAITILYRLEGSPDVSGLAYPFTDVAEDKYYADAVKWGYANNVIDGYSDELYGPEDSVTREQIAAILLSYELFSGTVPPAVLPDKAFEDGDMIGGWARHSVDMMARQGIVGGRPGGLFAPRAGVTRAEFAAMLHRYEELTKAK